MERFKLSVLAFLMVVGTMQISIAQRHMHEKGDRHPMHERDDNRPEIPDLTEEQKNKMNELRLEFSERIKPLENQLNEKRAKLKTLTDETNPDRNKIDKMVSEIGELKTRIDISEVNHRLDMKEILTEEQQLFLENNRRRHKRH